MFFLESQWACAAAAAALGAKQIVAWLSTAASVAVGIELVERRKRSHPLHPGRQITLATLLESMPEAVFVIDADGFILEANQAAERMSGIPRSKLMKMKGVDIAKLVVDQSGPLPDSSQWAISRALRGEIVRQERRRIVLRNSEAVEALVSANPIREQDGQIVGALIIVRDVTELAQLQEHMADAEKHHALGTMAASLAHDFNNVLDTISKATAVLEATPDRPAAERAVVLRMIRNAVKRGSEIVSQVRQYLRGMQSGLDVVDLNMLLEESIELTRPMWQSQQNISIIRQFQPVPQVRANAADMRRIFTNLIINAIEAMPNGGTLTVGGEGGAGKVRVFVEDTGEGIPPERQSKIFVPYYTTKREGTGLGLSSALRICRAHHGNITFTSKPGKGTRFVVELPALEKRAA